MPQSPQRTKQGSDSTDSKSSTDSTLEERLSDTPFNRIACFVNNSSLVVILLTIFIILISIWNLFREWILNSKNYLSAEQNWILFIHSVLTICCQLCLRWDVYYCSVDRIKDSKLNFNFRAFIFLLILEFVSITRIILVFYPLKGVSFWIHFLLILIIVRFCAQILVLNAIKIAKRESEDKDIKRMFRRELQRLRHLKKE